MVTAWGTTSSALTQVILYYFNPRSRVGNDEVKEAIQTTSQISIHVPAWGTTVKDCSPQNSNVISIHVPAWGTTCSGFRCIQYADFNPRSRVGNDGNHGCIVSGMQISIHVPAWGTTDGISALMRLQEAFQSTFPRGERLQISTIFHLYICISSTNSHFSITSFCIFYLIHFFLICFFQLFMVRIFWGFSVYFWFALYRNNT